MSKPFAALDIAATTCPGGAGKWRDEYNQHFKDASVVIIGDNDEPGRNHARDVAQGISPYCSAGSRARPRFVLA